MAEQTKPKSYPKISKAAWFYLRDRAQKSPSIKITSSVVMATFSLSSQGSARDNIVKPLTALDIIDDDGSLTELGKLWRNEDTYANACQKIVAAWYPDDLVGMEDAAAVERWFTAQGFGASNARQMAATYKLLIDAEIPEDVSLGQQKKSSNGKNKAVASSQSVSKPKLAQTAVSKQEATHRADTPSQPETPVGPSLQMNLQIHLPSNASAEQIDTIFASMAKHLYGK